MVVPNARFHLLCGSLQVLSDLETDPHFEHGRVALADAFEEGSAAALDTELPEDWESAVERVSEHSHDSIDGRRVRSLPLEQIEVRIETSPDAFEKENADDHVDEVAFHAHMMAPDHAQDFVQDVANLDVT